jgi:hypothetical protein
MATLATNRSHGGSSCDVVVGGLESDLLAGCCVHSSNVTPAGRIPHDSGIIVAIMCA